MLQRSTFLSDSSGKYSPDGWARQVVDEFYLNGADRIIADKQWGDLVKKMIYNIDSHVAYKDVRATRGKMVRAEPISALYEQGKVSHVGLFPELKIKCVLTQEKPVSSRST